MIFTETRLKGAFIIDISPLKDERGFFARSWCSNEFTQHGLNTDLAQCNLSFNIKKGTLRGMHYQAAPFQEVKLIRCIRGAIYDVIVDLRPESPTHREWLAVELTAENRRMLYVPEDFAHGYQTLADNSEIIYQVSEFYHPEAEHGICWDDPAIGIEWSRTDPIISAKDNAWPILEK